MGRQTTRHFSTCLGIVAIGVMLLGATPSRSQTYVDFSSKPNVDQRFKLNSAANKIEIQAAPHYAAAAAPIFSDDFNAGTLDLNKWRLGTNAGNQTAVSNNALQLRTQDAAYQSGWAVTHDAYPARNTTIAVKVIQPNNDGDLGMSPTYNLSSVNGIYSEANFYRFYTYRNSLSGPYLLYVQWKKNGVENGLDVTGNLVINGTVYLRLRGDDTKIHFEASLDGVTWTDTYNETFALPGYTLDTPFYYELAGYKTWANGALTVDDFSIASQSTDTQLPQISAVAAQNITGSSAQITWQTDEAADSQVEYGLTASYGSTTPLDANLVTSHSIFLAGLIENTTYHYCVRSKDAAGNLAVSNDFVFQTSAPGDNVTVLQDALNASTLGSRTGGQFVNGGGWQVTGVNDMIVYDLGRYVESGACEVRVRNFSPGTQNAYDRHHFLSMFRNPWGNHHPVENQETVWDLHAGFNYDPGVKMLSWTYIANEIETRVFDPWNLSQTYQIKVAWNGNQLQYFRDGVLYATHTNTAEMQLRYLFLGRDFTVSADLVTNFQNNQYPAIVGPIYSNLVVTEVVSATDQTPPVVENIIASDIYVNGARLAWTTGEPAVCYVEYGPTSTYGQKTPVLGPPAQTFATTLANLTSNQTYHYRIAALDNAGNLRITADQTFTTSESGTYVFKPVADTYVEQAGLYGTTRDYGNYGWMNLLGGAGRESYLRFNVTGVNGNVTQSILRLHGRQSGNGGGTLRVLTVSWNESSVTWRTKPNVTGQQLGAINSVQAGQWHEVNIGAVVSGNGTYNFALVGAGSNLVSFDSRESTNSQPELVIATAVLDVTPPVISNVAASDITTSSATINWTTNESSDSQVEYGLTTSYGSSSPLNTALVTSHTVALSSLQANRTYHYRVKSKDAAGNPAMSGDFAFTTSLPPANSVLLYTPFDVTLSTALSYSNPYLDISVTGVFTSPSGTQLHLNGFWDGGQTWRVRFTPNELGLWSYSTQSADPDLVTSGTFEAVPSDRHGFVRTSASKRYQFEYSDGTPFLLMGDTNWDGMSSGVGFETRFKPYIDLRVSQRFNAYHSIIVHNRYDYQSNEGGAPFAMFDAETRDYNRLNPGFFQWVDRRVAYADSSGMVSILFFTWANELQKMSSDQYQKLALYIVSRYAAYNVFWILAGDYQAYFYDPPLYRQVGNAVAAADPFDHPISIHPRDGFTNREFGNDAWLSYVMHQLRDAGEFLADSVRDTRLYNKPVVNGEYGYHVPASVHPYHGILQNANFTRTGGWPIFTAGGYFVAGFHHTFYDPDGHYPYDPGFDLPPTYWDLKDQADLEAARQYSVFYSFYHDQTSWWEFEPHREWVLDGQTELLAKPGAEYVAYNARGGRMRLQLPAGQYFSLAWFDPIAGVLQPARVFESTGETTLLMPSDTLDAVALLRPASTPVLTSLGDVAGLQRIQLNIRQVRFIWQTPEPADSRIDLQKPDGTRIQFVDNRETTAHDLVIDGLSPNVNYTAIVASQTADGREWKNASQNFLTAVQVMDEWIEAENMPTKTVGHAEPPGWNLDGNGHLAISRNFPQTGPYRFVIRCRGEYRNAWPTLSFQLDNNELAAVPINSAVFKEFAFLREVTAGTHQMKIAFTNAGDERQLIVDWLHVQFNGATDTQSPIISQVAATNLTTATATITWQTDEPADSQVEYGLTTSYDWSTPLDATLATSHTVTLSNLQANTTYHYRVKSKDAANNLAASGDFVFATLSPPPTLTLTSPNGGESWTVGAVQNITWSSTGTLPNVKLEFSVDNGANWATIIASTANDGSESWTIPNDASNQCLVRVSDAEDGNPADVSDAVFAIVAPPTLTLTSPNGGESWMVGTVQNITWNSTGALPNVKLEFSVDNGANWTTIIASTANDGSESWTIPNNASNQCLVRVSDAEDDNPADVSDAVFTIVAPPSPTVTLTSPNGGESWMVGTVQNIIWNSTGTLPNVKLEFSVDNGANWTTIIASTANDGSESWTIPNNVSTQCLVRVSDAIDGNPADVSDAVFAIVALPPPTVTLTSPNGGESWMVGAVQNITWNSTGALPNVKLEFSVDNGANWTTIIVSTANDGSEGWTIPNNASNQCLVRVSDAEDGNPADVSDDVFSIVAVPAPAIVSFAPTSGPVGTIVTITGSNFAGATSVAFNAMNATSFTVDSGTQIRAIVPTGAPQGGGKISVTNSAGTGVSENDFVVVAILTFNPPDDAYVRSDQPSSNYGTATTLRMNQSSPITNSYLKFVVSGINGTVLSAKLRLKVTVASSSGGSAYAVSNNYRTAATPWVESDLNYNNAPSISGTALSTIGSVTAGQGVEFDVTPAITGNGTFSFGLKNSSSTTVQYSSREGATKPELIIVMDPTFPSLSINDVTVAEGNIPQGGMNAVFTVSLSAVPSQTVTVAYATANGTATAGSDYVASAGIVTFPAGTTMQSITIPVIGDGLAESNETFLINLSNPANAALADAQGQGTIIDDDMVTITFNPTDDAYVRSDRATSNFGTATTLRMKQSSPITNSYLKFVVSGVSGPVLSAKLRLKVTVASSSGGSVYLVFNNYRNTSTPWVETGLNYNNAPSISGAALSTVGSVTANQVVEFEVTSAISGNGTFSFGLKNSSSTTVQYSSKEGAAKPELVIQFGTGMAAKIANLGTEAFEPQNPEIAVPLPERFALLPNYPNPFNAETRIVFQLPERSHVKLVLRDLMGRELKILINEEREAGTHEVGWAGRDASGNPLPSGIYIYTLQAGSFRSSKKLLVVK